MLRTPTSRCYGCLEDKEYDTIYRLIFISGLEGDSHKSKFFSTTCLMCGHEHRTPVSSPKKETEESPMNINNLDLNQNTT